MRDNQPLGIAAERWAQRDAILSTVRMSPAARARAMGRIFYEPAPSKRHLIIVDCAKPEERTVEQDTAIASIPAPRKTKTVSESRLLESLSPRVRGVLASVATAYSVSVGALVGPSRFKRDVHPRFAAALLLHGRSGFSKAQVGRILGKRDHTTAMSAIKRATWLLSNDPAWAALYRAAEHALDLGK